MLGSDTDERALGRELLVQERQDVKGLIDSRVDGEGQPRFERVENPSGPDSDFDAGIAGP